MGELDNSEDFVDPSTAVADEAALNMEIALRAGLNPDREIKVNAAAKRMALPPSIARKLPDYQLNEPVDTRSLVKKAPVATAFIADPANAAMVQERVHELAALEIDANKAKEAADKATVDDVQNPPLGPLEAAAQGWQQTTLGRLRFKQYFENDQAAGAEADKLSAESDSMDVRAQRGGMLRTALNTVTQVGGQMANSAMVAIPAGAVGAAIGSAVPGIGTASGFGAGVTAGFTADTLVTEAGLALDEMSQIKDLSGKPLDPTIMKASALGVGIINAGLEVTGLKAVAKVPMSVLKSVAGKKALQEALQNKATQDSIMSVVNKYRKTYGAEFLTGAMKEGGTEFAQEVSNILGDAIAVNLSDGAFSEKQGKVFTGENFSRATEAGVKGAVAAVGLGLPFVGMRAIQVSSEIRRSQAFIDQLKSLHETVQSSELNQKAPELMQSFLRGTSAPSEVYLDAQTIDKIPQPILDKLGVTEDQASQATLTGVDILVDGAKVLSSVSKDEFSQIEKSIKPTVSGFSMSETQNTDAIQEAKQSSEELQAQYKASQERFDAEIKRLRSDIGTAVKNAPKLRGQLEAMGVSEKDYINSEMAKVERVARTLERGSQGKAGGASFLEKLKIGVADSSVTLNSEQQGQEPAPNAANARFEFKDGAYFIDLFRQNANVSSLGHEIAHGFLQEMSQIAGAKIGNESFSNDWAALTKWLGVDLSAADVSKDSYKRAHEQFARGWEEYRLEGKAPTKELQGIFDRFREWLSRIYTTVKALGPDRVPLTDEVRGVFDRLLTGEQDVDSVAVETGLTALTEKDAKALGITPEETARINASLADLRSQAKSILFEKRNKNIEAKKKVWRKESEAELMAQPKYQVMKTLVNDTGLRPAYIQTEFGDATLKALQERRVISPRAETGLQVDDAESLARQHGYEDATAMVADLLDTETSLSAAVEKKVEEKFRQWDALQSADEAFVESSLDNYLSDMEKTISTAIAGKKTGKAKVGKETVNQTAYHALAKSLLFNSSTSSVHEAANVNKYMALLKKSLQRIRRFTAAGDMESSFKANQEARLHLAMVKESKDYKAELDKVIKRIGRIEDVKPGKIELQYRANLDALLQRYSLATQPPQTAPDQRTPLSVLLAPDPNEPQFDVRDQFPDWLVNEADGKHWQMLTPKDFEQVANLAKFLEKRGRQLVNDELFTQQLSASAITAECVKATADVKDLTIYPKESIRRKLADWKRHYFASLDQLVFVMRALDGYTNVGPNGTMGPNEKYLYHTLTKAFDSYLKEMAAAQKVFGPHFKVLEEYIRKSPSKLLDTGVKVPDIMAADGRVWTPENVVMIAMNMGTLDNRQKLMAGYGLSESDLGKLTASLGKAEWEAIQAIWDAHDPLFTKMNAVHERVNGFLLEKMPAAAFQVKLADGSTLKLKGGYHHLAYDPELDRHVAKRNERELSTNAPTLQFPTPATQKGQTKGRVSGVVAPVDLSVSVLGKNLDATIRYYTHEEAIRDVDRIFRSDEFYNNVKNKLGVDVANGLRPKLQRIARPNAEALDALGQINNWVRGNLVRYYLALNPKSAVSQLFGAYNIMADIGVGWYVRGIQQAITGGLSVTYEESAMMAKRSDLMYRDIKGSTVDIAAKQRIPGVNRKHIDGVLFSLTSLMDAIVAKPGWFGAREKYITEGHDIETASRMADEAIAITNPTDRPMDLSDLQASPTGLARMFTLLSGFTIKYGNRNKMYWGSYMAGQLSLPQFMRYVTLDALLPVMSSWAFYQLMWGRDWGDDEAKKELAADALTYQLQGLPFVREAVGGAMMVALGQPSRSISQSTTLAGFDMIQNNAKAVIRAVKDMEDDKKWEKAAWAFADTLGFAAGVPGPKVAKNLIDGMKQWEKGDIATINLLMIPDPKKRAKE